MIFNLAIILIIAFLIGEIFIRLRVPALIGMILTGIVLGPSFLNFIDPRVLEISSDLRLIALIIILLRAGFGIKRDELNQVKSSVIKLSFIPVLFEGLGIAALSIYFLDFSFVEGGILGFIIAAVSPAVIVPRMLNLQERKIMTEHRVPTIVLAGASVDDIVAITFFSSFLGIYLGKNLNIFYQFISIPLAIILGIFLGTIIGYLLIYIFKRYSIRDTKKTLIILAIAIIFNGLESSIKSQLGVEVATLLGVMSIAFIILEKLPKVGNRLALKFNKMWIFAEIILFLMVGASVNIEVGKNYIGTALIIISIGLILRGLGTYISLLGSQLNLRERLFVVVSYIPKATVQAAIGSIPLAAGVRSGEIILAIAVISILFTAPLGAISIDQFTKKMAREN